MDRAHRIGQTKDVYVYRLVTQGTVEERILERAELKLRLDAMIIQKGRNKNHNANNNKENLMDMIQYGAKDIFKSENSTITDDDIDKILNKGKQDTNQLMSKWEKASKKKFTELKLEFNYQTYENIDYSNVKQQKMEEQRLKLIQILNDKVPERMTRANTSFTKRINYNENNYFRDKINGLNSNQYADVNILNTKIKKPKSLPHMKYWQFYNEKELYQLYSKEWNFFNKHKNNVKYDPETQKALTDDEFKLKERLLNDGFGQIAFRDFTTFIKSCIKHGINNIDNIISDLKDFDSKWENKDEYIKKYHKKFFEIGRDIVELESYFDRIDLKEKRREIKKEQQLKRMERLKEKELRKQKLHERRMEIQKERELKIQKQIEYEKELQKQFNDIMNFRIKKWKNVLYNDGLFNDIILPDSNGIYNGFTKEFDKWLFINVYNIGYNNNDCYSIIKNKINNHPIFKYNYFIKSRNEDELRQRIKKILRACIQSKKNIKYKNNNNNPNKKRKLNDGNNISISNSSNNSTFINE